MVDWNTGNPNPRFRVLQLLHDNFGPGDKVVGLGGDFFSHNPYVYAMPVITKDGKKRVLLVNKSQNPMDVQLAGAGGSQMEYCDQTTGFDPAKKVSVNSDKISLNGFSVAVLTLK
jgi:hypothetical protein